MANLYCDVLGIKVPKLEQAIGHPEAKPYTLLIVALLERGSAMTLEEVARRFARAGYDDADAALASLKRCRPDRPPVYRDGDRYTLDPHSDELDLWVFRLGLRPPKVTRLTPRPEPPPLPGPETPLTAQELDEGLRDAYLGNWSAQRLAMVVLDSRGGRLPPGEVIAVLRGLVREFYLREESAQRWRKGAAIRVTDSGEWELDPRHDTLRSAREVVRQRVAAARERRSRWGDPAELEAHRRRYEALKATRTAELAAVRHVVVRTFPAEEPQAVALIDFATRELTTFLADELAAARERLRTYDSIAGLDVRAALRALGFDPETRRLIELSPPQKSVRYAPHRRPIKLTTELLIKSSCGIAKPFAPEAALHDALRQGRTDRLRDLLANDARSLFALFQYSRTHGAVRLLTRWDDDLFAVPWVDREHETTLYHLIRDAVADGEPLEVVLHEAPSLKNPWVNACRVDVEDNPFCYETLLIDAHNFVVNPRDVQIARRAQTRGEETAEEAETETEWVM